VGEVYGRLRAWCAIVTAAGLVLGASAVRAADSTGLGGIDGPVAAWLGRAPASCVLTSYFEKTSTGFHIPNSKHVAYWVGHAMDGDLTRLKTTLDLSWHGMVLGGTERLQAADDPRNHAGAYHVGGTDMSDWGILADEPDPPSGAPPMRADLSRLTLGGNVHLSDSLTTVTSALGLHALVPTVTPQCPGFSVVELCDWNVAGCACPPSMFYQGSHDMSGTLIFHAGRVVGLVWDEKCYAGG
jgi:hypothetical protein